MANNIKSKSFQMTQKTEKVEPGAVTARWSYSPGDVVMADEAHDDYWQSMSSIVISENDDSFCISEAEFEEDDLAVNLLPEIKEISSTSSGVQKMACSDDGDDETSIQAYEDPMIMNINHCYNSFRQLSLDGSWVSMHSQSEEAYSTKAPKRVSPPTPIRNTLSLSRHPSHRKLRKDRHSESQHNRSSVRESMRNLLD